MASQSGTTVRAAPTSRHASPPPGMVAIVFTMMHVAGIIMVSIFATNPSYPTPTTGARDIVAYFQIHPSLVLVGAFLQFGSAIPLGIFTASVASRLRFLGARAAGVDIAFLGGVMATLDLIGSACVSWVLTQPGITQDGTLTRALFSLQFVLGGPGYCVPLGLLLAGVCVFAGFTKLLPKWLVVLGLAIAVVGELSWFSLVLPFALFLLPLTRFPAFVWLIAAGFVLPNARLEGSQRDR